MNLNKRFLIFILFSLGVYFLPWIFSFVVIFILMLFYRTPLVELLIPTLLIDLIYGVPMGKFYNFQFVASLIFAGLLLIVFIVKKYFRN